MTSAPAISYTCVTCGRGMRTPDVVYRCPHCAPISSEASQAGTPSSAADAGRFQKGNLITVLTMKKPVQPGEPVDPLRLLPLEVDTSAFAVGNTPLVAPGILRESTGLANLSLKCDFANPSGSLKDRASLLVAAQARTHGQVRVALASTGNAGASMACAGAALGLEVILFVPASAPRAKLLQSLLYGARVVPVHGTYDDAFALSIRYTERFGGINRNTGYNPLTIEGKKTVSVEIFNQLGRTMPDVVYVPVGDGVILGGVWKGFEDLVTAGIADRPPVLVAVQAEGSNAIASSWRLGRHTLLASASTIADSLAVASPANGEMALACLRASGGRAIEVTDQEISAAQAELASKAGLFVEPASAAAWAGLLKDKSRVDPSCRCVVLLTGTGFKDMPSAEGLVRFPAPCNPDLESAADLLLRAYGVRS